MFRDEKLWEKEAKKAKYLNKTLKVFSTLSNNKHSCLARSRLFNHFAGAMRILGARGTVGYCLGQSGMGASIYLEDSIKCELISGRSVLFLTDITPTSFLYPMS